MGGSVTRGMAFMGLGALIFLVTMRAWWVSAFAPLLWWAAG